MSRVGHVLSRAVALLAITLLALPPAAVVTLLLMPLWSRIEASAGIESVGHSGPTAWCYVATWIAVSALLAALAGRVARRRSAVRASRRAMTGPGH